MNNQEFSSIKNKVAELLSVNLDYDFQIVAKEGVYASLSGDQAVIGGKETTDFYRALMLFSLEIKNGNDAFEINETRHFDKLGVSLDVSRNGVVRISTLKQILDCMALLGFNVLKLYMEDVYDLPGYPHFGYRRGKYSHEELRELDDYAYHLGIELIPGVQTLGHLGQYLRYAETSEFRENDAVLLCGEEKTYEFIEQVVKTMRKCLRSNRIMINCDEASGVGVSQIMKEKKYTSPCQIVLNHLDRVTKICQKYDFQPCIAGDLFYGHLGKGYYDLDFSPTKEGIKDIPELDIIYWDYYHTEYEDYETLLNGHRSLGRNVLFLGGIWIWAGQLPNVDFTFQTMCPALQCCIKNNVKEVWAATFGDDGNETNIAFALPQLLVFSEHCFKGENFSEEWVNQLATHVFRLDFNAFRAVSDYHYPWIEGLPKEDYPFPNYMGKKIFYTDILYNMVGTYDFSDILPKHKAILAAIKKAGKGTPWESYFEYATLILEITVEKMQLLPMIKTAYQTNDRMSLQNIAQSRIPKLIKKYEHLMFLHEMQWMKVYKPFGWEELNVRYMGIIGRLQYAQRTILSYLENEIQCIEEMEYEFIEEKYNTYHNGKNVAFYRNLKSTGL